VKFVKFTLSVMSFSYGVAACAEVARKLELVSRG
jgi:hypothetical protein